MYVRLAIIVEEQARIKSIEVEMNCVTPVVAIDVVGLDEEVGESVRLLGRIVVRDYGA